MVNLGSRFVSNLLFDFKVLKPLFESFKVGSGIRQDVLRNWKLEGCPILAFDVPEAVNMAAVVGE